MHREPTADSAVKITNQYKLDRQSTCNITLRRVRAITVGRGKAITLTYSKCLYVAFGIQHVMRMCHAILLSVACPALHYFSILSHKLTRFLKNGY
jgi:hypothetical protein